MRDSLSDQLNRIEDLLSSLSRKVELMNAKLEELKVEVEKTTSLQQSAVTLIQGLAAQIAALKNDPAEIQALSDRLKASAQMLSDAITANTPAA